MDLGNLAANKKVFHCSNEVSVGSATETPVFLLKNPSANTVKMYLAFFLAGTDTIITGALSAPIMQGLFISRIYGNPTVTANGTAIGIFSSFITASPPSSVMQVFKTPTVTANGNRMWTSIEQSASSQRDLKNIVIIDPGNSALVTCLPVNPTSLAVRHYFAWVEV